MSSEQRKRLAMALLLAAVVLASCDDGGNYTRNTDTSDVQITDKDATDEEIDGVGSEDSGELTLLDTTNLLIAANTEANTLYCRCSGDMGSGFCAASPGRCYPTPAACESDKNQNLPTDAQCLVDAINLNPDIAVAAAQCTLDAAVNYKNCLQQSSCSALSVDTCVSGWEQHLAVCASFPPEVEAAMAACP